MARYLVYFEVYAQTYVEVDAADETEARSKAEEAVEVPQLCHQCEDPFEVNDLGEITGVELQDD